MQVPSHELLHDADAVCGRGANRVLHLFTMLVQVFYKHMNWLTFEKGAMCGTDLGRTA